MGVIAQLRAGDTDAAPIAYLESLQKANGSWSSLIPASGDFDVDSTAMALMALALLPNDTTAVAAVTKGIAWLAAQQQADGGFLGFSDESTNSTALAIMGLTLAGSTDRTEIAGATTFLAGQQNSDGGFTIAPDVPGSDVRASAQVVSGLIGTSFGTLSDDIAPAPATGNPTAAAAYLVTQLVDGTHLNFPGGTTPNYGGTADLAIALAATGTQDTVLATVVSYLEQHVADYADPDAAATDFPGPYSGAAAKLALLAEITGQDPTAFGGFDLVTTLTGNLCSAATADGACTAAGEFYQAFSGVSQALGVLALARAGVTPPAATVTRLGQLQCPDGGFSSELIAAGAACTSDVDTTGYAVQALEAASGTGPAISAAVSFLLSAQQADGGFDGASGENTNSTALAVQALIAASQSFAPQTIAPQSIRARLAAAGTPTAATISAAITAGIAWLAAQQGPSGGFAISAADPTADALATAQAGPAITRSTLTSLRHAITITTSPSGGPGTGTGSTSTSTSTSEEGATDTSSDVLAFTGIDVGLWIGWAIALLVLGCVALLAGLGRLPRRRKAQHA